MPSPWSGIRSRHVIPWARIRKPRSPGRRARLPISTRTPVEATVVARGLNHPWALAFLPNGHMLITEKPGTMRVLSAHR